MSLTSPSLPVRSGSSRRPVTVTLTTTLLLGALLLGLWGPSPARAAETVTSARISGEHRYATAAQVAEVSHPDGAEVVLVASGRNFPDALAASGLAGVLEAPVLLTDPEVLPEETAEALTRLGPREVRMVGGTAAVSEAVEDDITAIVENVDRIAGSNRYATAADIAAGLSGAIGTIAGRRTALIATGENYPDALALGPLASQFQLPVLLTRSSRVPAETLSALGELGIEQVVIAGGTAVVTGEAERALEDQVGAPAIRLGGVNRSETSTLVADFATRVGGFTATELFVADGTSFADAIAAGPLAGRLGAPILLVEPSSVPDAVTGFLLLNDALTERITAVGGTRAVPNSVLVQAVASSTSDPDAEAYTLELSWVNEVVDGDFFGGQPEGVGIAVLKLSPNKGTIAYLLDAAAVVPPFTEAPGAHIHRGSLSENGPIVAPLATGQELQNGQGGVAGYIREGSFSDTSVTVADMIASPEDFYVNVHSAAYPAGAIRGQLPEGGQAAVADAVNPLAFTLDAAHELTVDEDTGTVNYGASTETGTAEVALTFDLNTGEIDYRLDVSGIDGNLGDGAGAHIHEGLIDQNGEIVVTLASGEELASAPDGVVTGTITADDFREDFELLTVKSMFVASSEFYVNVHTAENPAGAVRGQLPDGGQLPSS